MITKQENGKWLVDIRNEGRGSKRVRKSFDIKREAQEFVVWFKSQKSPDAWVKQKDSRRLIDAVENNWISVGQFQNSGKDKYNRLKRICECLGNPLLKDINSEMLLAYRSSRLIEDGIEAETANKEMIYVSSVIRHVGLTPPTIKKIKVVHTELRYLEIDEIRKLLEDIKERSFGGYVICKIALETGARWGEASNVVPSQIKNGVLGLPSKHTKNKKPRYIPISDELANLINENAPLPDATSTFRRSIDACGIDLPNGQMTHVLRHTFASHFIANGGNIVALQKILDHCSLNVTMRYAHLSPEHFKDVLKYKPEWGKVDT